MRIIFVQNKYLFKVINFKHKDKLHLIWYKGGEELWYDLIYREKKYLPINLKPLDGKVHYFKIKMIFFDLNCIIFYL